MKNRLKRSFDVLPDEPNLDNTIDSSFCRDCYFRCHYINWIKSEV